MEVELKRKGGDRYCVKRCSNPEIQVAGVSSTAHPMLKARLHALDWWYLDPMRRRFCLADAVSCRDDGQNLTDGDLRLTVDDVEQACTDPGRGFLICRDRGLPGIEHGH